MRQKTTPIASRVNEIELTQIDSIIGKGRANNRADFLKQAIREKINREANQ